MSFVPRSQISPDGCYVFASRPRPVEARCRPREPPPQQTHGSYGNVMYDRRVVRGNTYARHIIPTTAQPNPVETQRRQDSRRRVVARQHDRDRLGARTPEALQGRKHIDVQTELYLEELSAVVVTAAVECQTDAFVDRPATPLFIPTKSVIDVETQIEEGELFDFDWEVQPVLEFLVGKTIEQSLQEVIEEEELACLKARQKTFQELRNNKLAEVLRLQEQERRHSEEKERRFAQQKKVLKAEIEVAEKIAARAFTQEYMADLVPSVFISLRSHGFFSDPVEKDIETNFFPWLMAEVHDCLEKRYTARKLLDTIIHDVVQKRQEMFKAPQTQS